MRRGMLQLWRTAAGPRPDGLIHMSVEVDESITEEAARELLRRARDMVEDVAATDAAFAELLRRHQSRWELVHDPGMGSVLLAVSDQEGNLVWQRDAGPA